MGNIDDIFKKRQLKVEDRREWEKRKEDLQEMLRVEVDDRIDKERTAAVEAADEECAYTADLTAGFPNDVWISVNREPSAEGIGERYSVFKRLMIGAHKM